MPYNKFHEKAVALYGKKQAAEGVAETLAGADAVAVLNLDWNEVNSTSEYEYAGNNLSRDVETDIEDTYSELNFETFLPVTGGATSLALDEFAEACGAAIVTLTAPAGIEWTNEAASAATMTQQFRRSSDTIATEKTFGLLDAVGTLDIELEVGKKGMIKFAYMGNKEENPTQETALTADFGTQKTAIGTTIRAANIQVANIGTVDTIATTSNVCLSKISAANFFGFGFERVLLGCQEEFSKGATANDFTITLVEDSAGNNFDAYEEKGKDFSFTLKYGLGVTSDILIHFARAQLVDVQPTTVGTWAGLDLTFKNRDISKVQFT